MKVRDPFHLYALASLRIRIGMKPAWRKATSQPAGVLRGLLGSMRMLPGCWWGSATTPSCQVWRHSNKGNSRLLCLPCWTSHTRTHKQFVTMVTSLLRKLCHPSLMSGFWVINTRWLIFTWLLFSVPAPALVSPLSVPLSGPKNSHV